MQNTSRKIISAFLTLAMMLGLILAMPLPASAADSVNWTQQPQNQSVTENQAAKFTVKGMASWNGISHSDPNSNLGSLGDHSNYGGFWQVKVPGDNKWYWITINDQKVTSPTLEFRAVKDSDGKQYRYCAWHNSNYFYSEAATLTVTPAPPVITKQPQNKTFVPGETVQFTVEATGTDTLYYVWYVNGSILSSERNKTLTITNTTAAMSGNTYYCKVSNGGGRWGHKYTIIESASATLKLLVPPPSTPTITSQSGDRTIAVGENTTFTVVADNATDYSWERSPDGVVWAMAEFGIFSGGNTNELKLTNITTNYNGYWFRCIVKNINDFGSAYTISKPVKLTVTGGDPPSIHVQPVDMSITAGQSTTFVVSAWGGTLQWQCLRDNNNDAIITDWANISNAGIYSGVTTSELKLTDVPIGYDGYKYRCVLTNAYGTTTSNAVTLTVLEPLTWAITIYNHPTDSELYIATAVTELAETPETEEPTEPETEPTLTTEAETESTTEISTEPATEPAIEPTAEIPTEPQTEIATEPTPETPTEPQAEIATESATEPATEPPTESTTSTTEPTTESATTPPPPPFPFTDVVAKDWFYNNIKSAWEMGLVNGKTTTTYEPTANLTYAEAVKLAACMHQYHQEGKVTLEIGAANWYDTYVAYAKTNNIISKDYEWNANATRAGYMEIFANALPDSALGAQNSVTNGSIPDVPMSHPQAWAIYKLYRAGIVQGVDAATHACNPNSNIQRSEVAAIIARMMNPSDRISFTLG